MLIALSFILVLVAAAFLLARPRREPALALEVLGFSHGVLHREGLVLEATIDGRDLKLSIALRRAPITYDRLARALGRGDLLASIHALGAKVDADRLSATAPADVRLRALRRWLDALVALARDFEALPVEEGVARWVLDYGEIEPPEPDQSS
jgi:hypothetical protein